MSMKKNRKYAAACIGGGMMLAAAVMIPDFNNGNAFAASLSIAESAGTEAELESEAAEDTGASLALAASPAEEKDTEAATENGNGAVTEAAEAPVDYDTVETTHTGEEGITAMDVSGIVENCMPSIVSITKKSVQEVQSYLYGSQEIETESASSGIIIAQNDTELLIATNNHVVEGSKEMTVCFTVDAQDEEDLVAPAVTKGTNSEYDLAVVAVKLADIPADVRSQLRIATLGSSADLKVGETAIAIGNALGTGQTVTSGIISALEREVAVEEGTFTELQTDAAINLGCSGGALLNKRGEVIGINSAKAAGNYAESMGYAIPIDDAIPILTDLINRETREVQEQHGYLGITVVPVSDEAKQMYNMPAGAYVYEVTEGSAGEAAGLKKGDIITKFDGQSVSSSTSLVDTMGYYAVGETVTIEVQTAEGGSYVSKELEVTLQKGAEETDDSKGEQQNDSSNSGQIIPYGEDGTQGNSQDDAMNEFYNDFFENGGSYGDGNGINSIPYTQEDGNNGL